MPPPYALIDPIPPPSRSPGDLFQSDMIHIHNVYIRALNSIYAKATVVKPKDVKAFVGYCLSACEAIHSHHHHEETIVFPFLSKGLDMSHNIEQHQAFHDGFEAFEAYLKLVGAKKEKFDGEKLRALLVAVADPLTEHLRDEIPTIAPSELAKLDKKELEVMINELGEAIKNQGGATTVFPFTFSHHDHAAAPDWPSGVPVLIIWLASHVFNLRHSSYWKFSPYDFKHKPRSYNGVS